ncbi:serine/threonine-protein kinase, partial [Streptomyces sp. URMC 126]|uniref:serine/threonine-protein kinase n=1 Tax=Streptomyces sp. URMC 126 TaxID=3423401 RepID=UPI003F1C5412
SGAVGEGEGTPGEGTGTGVEGAGSAGAGVPPSGAPADVALKILSTEGLAPRQARGVAEAARREVELGSRARHPRLIRLLDSFVLGRPGDSYLDGAIVLVMERAAGSLRDRLAAGVTPGEGARLVTEICEGLAHLHRSGWVHGDLKPDNVLLMADGSVRLSDFGLATELTATQGTHGYAPPMGTFDYLPPERWKAPLGEHGVRVRPSADVWALGILIHQVFASGATPFPGATPVSRAAAAQEYAEGRAPLRVDPAVPPFWRDVITDCLAPTHAARAAHTADALLDRIAGRPAEERAEEPAEESAEGPAEGAGPRSGPAPSPHRPHPERRKRARAAAALAASVAAVVAASWAYAGGGLRGGSGPPHETAGSTAAASAGTAAEAASGQAGGRIRVFNAEKRCRDRAERTPDCSLGLAIDPLRPYTIDNVVPARVWHGDVLATECQLTRGVPIVDETGTWSALWFRVRLPDGSRPGGAWLPAVRTKDRPSVPACPRPTPTR